MNILGLSAFAHDSAAALIIDGEIKAAIEESKLVRARDARGMPTAAIRFCLDKAGIDWSDVNYVAAATPLLRGGTNYAFLRDRLFPATPTPIAGDKIKPLGELGNGLDDVRLLREVCQRLDRKILTLDHHLCHAASAFFASPFDRALILVLDEGLNSVSGLIALGQGTEVYSLGSIPFPHSPAWVYSQITELIGFAPHRDEHKTQWLSLKGEPGFVDIFKNLFRRWSGRAPQLAMECINWNPRGNLTFSTSFFQKTGLAPGNGKILELDVQQQLANSMQLACSDALNSWAESLRRETNSENLCLAGGLFLNPLLVEALERNTGFTEVFVQPAAGNPGCALGSAWLTWHQKLGKARNGSFRHLYWGPSYTSEEIKKVLDNCKALYHWCDTDAQKIDRVVGLMRAGKIVAWYQGATEFGPRALGNRSLLASPWAPFVIENLNEYIKRRESFRPFAIAVAEDDAAQYFESSAPAYFLASLGRVRPSARKLFEDFALPGGKVRLHVVERQSNPLLYRLLKRFGEHAPAPCLVNTSFNLFGEPLVTRPREAVRSYFCSGIDALMIGNFVLEKR